MIVLYARVTIKPSGGRRVTCLGQFLVPHPELLTDELCEKALNQMVAQKLQQYPAGSVVVNQEFISRGEYDTLCRIAGITHRKGRKEGAIYTIYLKAVGTFPDPDNRYGFGVEGPEIPFYLYSAVPFEQVNEDEKVSLKEKVIALCQERFCRAPADVMFIDESEYDLLEQKFQEDIDENE